MATLTVAKRRKNPVLLFVPIAAVLAASLAFAKNGEVVRRAWGWLSGDGTHDGNVAPRVVPARPAALHGASSVEAPAEPEPESLPAPPEQGATPAQGGSVGQSAPIGPSTTVEAPAHNGSPGVTSRAVNAFAPHAPTAQSNNGAPAAPIASDEAEEAALGLYRTAHRLHFVDHDYAAALGAWDDYLRAEPRGRLAVEARYRS
jgi:hypothetical protein